MNETEIKKTHETYKVSKGNVCLTLTVHIAEKKFTMLPTQGGEYGGRDNFLFKNSKVETAIAVVDCMAKAIEKAQEVLSKQE